MSGGTTITWFGHACIEIQTPGGKTILFDPWFGIRTARGRSNRWIAPI